MAYFYRLVFSFALAFASITCYAYAPIVVGQSDWSITATGANLGPDLQAGWVARIVGFYGSPNGAVCGPVTVSAQGVSTAGCYSTYMSDDVRSTPIFGCPDSSPVVNGQCVCSLPATEENGVCVAPPAPVGTAQSVCDAMNATGVVYSRGGALGSSACMSGTTVQASMAATGAAGTSYAGKTLLYGPFSCSGEPCTNGPSNTASQNAPEPCMRPKQSGTVNGVSVCLDAPSTLAPGSSSAAPTPVGSASNPTSGLGADAPPSATSSASETTCSGGSCTTKTTFKDSGGAVVGEKSDTEPQSSFCDENPSSPMCAESRFSGGSCGAPDTCSGDAIQCAIQAQAKATKCALTTEPTGQVIDAYTAAAGRTLQDETAALAGNPTVNISPGSFDQTELLGAAVGMQDRNVTIMGSSIVMPFSTVNVWLERLGVILQAVTFLLCVRIVSRG